MYDISSALQSTQLAAAAIAGAANIASTKISYKDARKMAKEQNEWNIQNWERVNEYNLPVNQIQRLKDAGLNPNLMYGKGDVGNASQVTPMVRAERTQMPYGEVGAQLISALGQALINANKSRELDIKDKQTEALIKNYDFKNRLLDMQHQSIVNQLPGIKANSDLENLRLSLFRDTYDNQVISSAYDAEAKQLRNTAQLMLNSWLPSYQKLEFQKGMAQLDYLVSSKNLNYSKVLNLTYDNKVKSASISLIASQIGVNQANAESIYAGIQKIFNDMSVSGRNISLKESEFKLKKDIASMHPYKGQLGEALNTIVGVLGGYLRHLGVDSESITPEEAQIISY